MAVAAANPQLSRRGEELRPGEPTGRVGWALPRQVAVRRGASWLSSCPCAQPIPSPLLPEQGRGGRGRAQGRGLLPWLWLLGWVEGLCAPRLPGLVRTGVTLERPRVPTQLWLLAERPGLPPWAPGAPAAKGSSIGPSVSCRSLSLISSCDTFPRATFLMP